MGRPLRIDFEGAWHHVMHRGAGRRIVFRDDDDRRIMLRLIGELHERFAIEVHSYVLMGNHFHLLIRSADGRLSDGMQWLLSNYTRWVNARRSVDGAIFRGRFHGVNVTVTEHRTLLFRYLAENPLDLSASVDPVTYQWSSFAHVSAGAVDEQCPWLFTELIEELYGERGWRLADQIRRAADDAIAGGSIPPLAQLSTLEEEFGRLRAAADAAAGLGGVVERQALRVGTTLFLLDAAGRWTRSELAGVVGLTPSAVGSAIHRVSAAAEQDASIGRFVDRVGELFAADTVPLGV